MPVDTGTAGADDRAEAVGRLGQCVRSDRFPPRGVTPLTPIMGRATDPGENHDPGNDQRFTPSLTQEPRLEPSFAGAHLNGKVAPIVLKKSGLK